MTTIEKDIKTAIESGIDKDKIVESLLKKYLITDYNFALRLIESVTFKIKIPKEKKGDKRAKKHVR
jgi:ferritin-like protein